MRTQLQENIELVSWSLKHERLHCNVDSAPTVYQTSGGVLSPAFGGIQFHTIITMRHE